jgi:lipid A disaccharide synthetase
MLITGTKYVGLANIIWDKCGGEHFQPMPELLQRDFTPEKVSCYLKKWFEDDSEREKAVLLLEKTVKLLKSDGDAVKRIASEVVS